MRPPENSIIFILIINLVSVKICIKSWIWPLKRHWGQCNNAGAWDYRSPTLTKIWEVFSVLISKTIVLNFVHWSLFSNLTPSNTSLFTWIKSLNSIGYREKTFVIRTVQRSEIYDLGGLPAVSFLNSMSEILFEEIKSGFNPMSKKVFFQYSTL